MNSIESHEKDFVILFDSETNIKIIGQLTIEDDECVVEGVIEGISAINGYDRPERLHGKSSRRRFIWIDQLMSFSPRLPGDDSIPATVRLISTSVYHGEFDPRSEEIDRLACPISHIHRLTDDLPVERTVSGVDRRLTAIATIDAHRCNVFADRVMRIGVDYLPSVGEHVTYEQVLVVQFELPTSLDHATRIMDRALVLLSLIAGATIDSPERIVSSGSEYTTEWKARARSEDVSNPRQWLVQRPDQSIKLLRELMPGWLRIDDDELLLARMFLGAAHQNVYIESRFLTYCQVFEHLNTRRKPNHRMDDGKFTVSVLEHIAPVISALEVNARTKRAVTRAISDANRLSLEERLAHAFSEKPDWIRLLDSGAEEIRASVCKRRNALSHGSPSGAVRDQQSAVNTQIDRHFIYLHCLNELFVRCGIDEAKVRELVSKSEDVSTLLWLARRRAGADSS